jgi:hypothetical protein
MFIRHYIELPLPVANVEQALAGSPAGWLSAVAGEAQARGDGLLGEVGVGPLGARLRRQVKIRLGEPVRFPSMTSLPFTWVGQAITHQATTEQAMADDAPPAVGDGGGVEANAP